jgi:hypothetical protein
MSTVSMGAMRANLEEGRTPSKKNARRAAPYSRHG